MSRLNLVTFVHVARNTVCCWLKTLKVWLSFYHVQVILCALFFFLALSFAAESDRETRQIGVAIDGILGTVYGNGKL